MMITQYKNDIVFRLCIKDHPRYPNYPYTLWRTVTKNPEQVNEYIRLDQLLNTCNIIRG